jgi:hypothetical protein
MDFNKWNEWFSLIANVGVVVGIVFLALEIRANTASNRIALQTEFSANWVQINGDVATNRDLATVIDKAKTGKELDSVDREQLDFFIAQRMSQAALMRRLYVEGFATRQDVHTAYRGLRRYAQFDTFRMAYGSRLNERNQKMVFEDNGVDWWLDAIDSGQRTD